MGLGEQRSRKKFWLQVACVTAAMGVYKASTGFSVLIVPLVLVEMDSIDPSDEQQFNTWVSAQVLALYLGETFGELLTGALSDKYPKLVKKMLLFILFMAGIGFGAQGVVTGTLLDKSIAGVMPWMTLVRFFNGFFSPAVLGSIASFQLVEREDPKDAQLRTSVESMRPVALYLGDVIGCIIIIFAPYFNLAWLFGIVAIGYMFTFTLVLFTLPDQIVPSLGGNLTKVFPDSDSLSESITTTEETKLETAKDVPNYTLFKHYVWNRAVLYIFTSNMMNSLFNSIVGADQVVFLNISEVLLSIENIIGSLVGVAVAWAFMMYLFNRLHSTKSLLLTSFLSLLMLIGMPWGIQSLTFSVLLLIVYTPIAVTQDAIAIISGASYAVANVSNSEGFAYGFLNAISMVACGIAPIIYTILLSIFSKFVVWFILASFFGVFIVMELIHYLYINTCSKSGTSEEKKPLVSKEEPLTSPLDKPGNYEDEGFPQIPEIRIYDEDEEQPIDKRRSYTEGSPIKKNPVSFEKEERATKRKRAKSGISKHKVADESYEDLQARERTTSFATSVRSRSILATSLVNKGKVDFLNVNN